MAITLVTTKTVIGPFGGTSSPPVDTTGATLLVVSASYYSGGSSFAVSDGHGNTWTPLTLRTVGNIVHRIYYAKNPTVGPGASVNITGVSIYVVGVYLAFAGVDPSAPFDGETGATAASGTSLATGSVTPSVSGALIIAGLGSDSATGISVSAGLTATTTNFAGGNNMAGGTGYVVQPSAAAINPTWSWTGVGGSAAGIAAFKPAAATPAAVETAQPFVWGPI